MSSLILGPLGSEILRRPARADILSPSDSGAATSHQSIEDRADILEGGVWGALQSQLVAAGQ